MSDVCADGHLVCPACASYGAEQERRRIFDLFKKKCRELRREAPGLQGMSILIREVEQEEKEVQR